MISESKPFELRYDSPKRAMKSANEKLRRSSRHRNPTVRYGNNKYMVHHYAYMMKVASIRELGSIVEASKDARWQEANRGRNATWTVNNT